MKRFPIEGIDYFVYYIDMHGSIGGYITPNLDGTFTVYLNKRLNRERNIKSIHHELEHMINDDFEKNDVRIIEGI